jgi:hypothetical protein
MAIKVEIVKKGYGHSIGQVLTLNEFDAGHLMAFGFAVPYVAKKYESQIVSPPETRIAPAIEEKPVDIIPAIKKPVQIFKRRGRKPSK